MVQCLAHSRRKFDETLKCLKEEDRKICKTAIGLAYCNKLFKIEEKISELSPEEKYIKRQELSKPVLDDFFSWLNSFTPASQSHLGKAVAYTLNQWKNLQNYLLDGKLNICNNLAEHLAKSFALCRKNFLFSNTPRGAEASATVMSIVETAKANKDFIIGMAEDFVNDGDHIGFKLDFTYYFVQKYDKMCKEDEMFTDMINYYLFEKAFDIHKNDSEEKLRKIRYI